jgi:N-acetylglucosaminyldiphosphoundecaprenol N-acetyl-beta-D-mannosaminyltransferase
MPAPAISQTPARADPRPEMRSIRVLGTPLLVTNYSDLGAACREWARSGGPVALDFANTQIVTMRRHNAEFRELTSGYDGFPPDGMPLIWCLNRAGAGLKDRVYGPTFMRSFLKDLPSGYSHYLLGGTEECGRRLREVFQRENASLNFVGSFYGRCQPDGKLDSEDEKHVLEELNRLSPDFIWVGFGTPKQQGWVKWYKPRMKRGVILTVGFAFDVNAGMKPDAPAWMQRLGLTWVFRLATEPRRLGPRYFKYNFLFVWYLLWDGLRGKALGRPQS